MVSRHHALDCADDGKNTYSASNALLRLFSTISVGLVTGTPMVSALPREAHAHVPPWWGRGKRLLAATRLLFRRHSSCSKLRVCSALRNLYLQESHYVGL